MSYPQADANRLAASPVRRRTVRNNVRYLRVYSPVPGTILNLDAWGMCLETIVELEPGETHVFKVRRGSMLFSLRARVRWSCRRGTYARSPKRSIEHHRCGVSFDARLDEETLGYLVSSG